MKGHSGFQIRQHNPWRLWLSLGLVVFLLLLSFFAGKAYQVQLVKKFDLERETMEQRVAELEQRNEGLVKRNAQLERTSKIEHDAYIKANEELATQQKELLKMKEKLVFYQGIVSPDQLALGVNIQSFEIKAKKPDGMYGYKLVLSKRGKSNKTIKGDFELNIKGQIEGKSESLQLKKVKKAFAKKDQKFSFRYFQVFEGDIEIPGEFTPYELVLDIKPGSKKIKPFTENISWAEALAGGNS